jgi:hypothetical protein
MAELSKIQRVSFQWNIKTEVGENTWESIVINHKTLNMPSVSGVATNNLPTTGVNANVAYLINVTALAVDGIYATNGAITKTVSLSCINDVVNTYPLPVSQVTNSFIVVNYFDVYVASRTVDLPPATFPGVFSVEDGEINILLRTTQHVSNARIKVFAEIFSYGTDSW